jgi:hypothetical protein
MGLDIYLLAQSKHPSGADQYAKVGDFRKVNALFGWVETHTGPIENQVTREITKAHLNALNQDLQSLTPETCATLFPCVDGFFFGSTEYDTDYWQTVATLIRWIDAMLATFDFENDRLLFYAWW